MFKFFTKITKRKIKLWERENQISNILPVIHSDTYTLRIAAIQALGNIGDKSVVSELIELLDHKNKFIRTEIENALLKIDSSEFIREIIQEKRIFWENVKQETKTTTENSDFDKDFYGWKGRFKRNISRTKAVKESLKRPMRWG